MTSHGALSSKSVVLDASVWVSIDIPTDSNHAVATAWVNGHLQAGGYFREPTWFMVEVAAAVSRQVSMQAALAATALLARLRQDRKMRFVPMSAALLQDTIDIATTHRIRAGDAVYIALARRLGIPLVSFDKDHLTRASGIVTMIKP